MPWIPMESGPSLSVSPSTTAVMQDKKGPRQQARTGRSPSHEANQQRVSALALLSIVPAVAAGTSSFLTCCCPERAPVGRSAYIPAVLEGGLSR